MMRVYALGILGRFSSSLSDGTRIASGRTVSVSAQALGFRGAARQLPVIEAITTVSRLNIDNAAHRKLWKTLYCLSPPAGITFSPAAPPGAEESPTTHKKRLLESTFIPASSQAILPHLLEVGSIAVFVYDDDCALADTAEAPLT